MAHHERDDVHRPALHAARVELAHDGLHLVRVHPVVGGPAVLLVDRADVGAVLDARHVGGVGGRVERVRLLLGVQAGERAGGDQGVGELDPLLVGAGAPVDPVRGGQRCYLVDEGQDAFVRGRRVLGGGGLVRRVGGHACSLSEHSRPGPRGARPATERTGGVCRMSSSVAGVAPLHHPDVTPKLLPGTAARNRGWGEGTVFRPVGPIGSIQPSRRRELCVQAHVSGGRGASAASVSNPRTRPISPGPPRRLELRSPQPHRGSAPVAQRIEHLTTDQKVGGSNLSRRARPEAAGQSLTCGFFRPGGLRGPRRGESDLDSSTTARSRPCWQCPTRAGCATQ